MSSPNVTIDDAAPIVITVAAPNAFTVVAVVLNSAVVVLAVLIPVVNVGLVANTNAPLPVSSLITPASCELVVAAN
jgi:hypothetical protein